MSSGITDFGSATWLPALMGITAVPSGYYVALLLDEPGPAMDGDILADLEPTDTGYQRQHYGASAANWGVADQFITTLHDINFGVAGYYYPNLDWGLITHYALCTAATSGDVYAWGEFLSPGYVAAGMSVTIPAGGIVLALNTLDPTIAV